ncbi:MAG: fumarylacetoacetate hydrolase family protein [Chloroflexi bacterium]|nr:fumarylacetoacetate hydrolase family protein [Chloroflexota bacterium]
MRLATFLHNDTPTLGLVREEGIIPAPGLSMLEAIEQWEAVSAELARLTGPAVPLARERLLAPIPKPRRNIMCLGLNYAEHIKESADARGREAKTPAHPVFFTKATHAVNGPYANIPFDESVSAQIDWEAEMAVVIGRGGKSISQAEAMSFVFGYSIINDVSARDLQFNHGQFFKGKSLDGACPMGPWIVTADEILDPHNLPIRCRVNGETKQEANTGMMIFKIPAIIESLSRGMTLEPGDVIATGTPSGVGFARTPPEFLKPGDVVECEVESIGLLRNKVG